MFPFVILFKLGMEYLIFDKWLQHCKINLGCVCFSSAYYNLSALVNFGLLGDFSANDS